MTRLSYLIFKTWTLFHPLYADIIQESGKSFTPATFIMLVDIYLIISICLLQALCRAEDEEDIVAASQAKAEQVAELAEFNENIPLDDGGEQEEVEELSKAEQEIAALVEQVSKNTSAIKMYNIIKY